MVRCRNGRVALIEDAAAIAAIYAHYVRDTAVSFEVEPPAAAEIAQRMGQVLAGHPWLVAEISGRVVGYAYGCEHRARRAYRWSVDVAVYLSAEVHRQGIGRRLYRALFALLRAQAYVNAYAGIVLPNDASLALHQSMGFEPVGTYRDVGFKAGRWRDVGWWSLLLNEPSMPPKEPQRFATLSRDQIAAVFAGIGESA
jgi:phosphinothricin acetyltransferase